MPSKITCLECGSVLVSVHRHDYKTCDCPNRTMIDGGSDYVRYGGRDMDKVRVEEFSMDPEDPAYDHALVSNIKFWNTTDARLMSLANFDDDHLRNVAPMLLARKSKYAGACQHEIQRRGLAPRQPLFDEFYKGRWTREVTADMPPENIHAILAEKGWHMVVCEDLPKPAREALNDLRRWIDSELHGPWFNDLINDMREFWFELEEDAVALAARANFGR